MENIQRVVFDTVTTTLAALGATDKVARAENAPVIQSYRKHIIWLKKRNDEASLEVVIKGDFTWSADCNRISMQPLRLHKAPSGYYELDYPLYDTTRMACPITQERTMVLAIPDNVFTYSSSKPIVIHAYQAIDISYEVQPKAAATAD
jgi:serine protease inhibitor ecotin